MKKDREYYWVDRVTVEEIEIMNIYAIINRVKDS